jgi:hypothetical protein
VTREELDRLEAESDAADRVAKKASEKWLAAYEEWKDGLTPDEKEAELRREVADNTMYVGADLVREVLNRLDELRGKGGAK